MTTSVDELYGLDVHAADGKLLGKVDDIYLDDVTARPTIARVKHGLAGRKVWLVPIVSATRQASGLVVPYAEATIEHAPLVEPRDHITAEQEAQLLDYYGIALESITRPPVARSSGVAGSPGVEGDPWVPQPPRCAPPATTAGGQRAVGHPASPVPAPEEAGLGETGLGSTRPRIDPQHLNGGS